jgi:hypothetical protein
MAPIQESINNFGDAIAFSLVSQYRCTSFNENHRRVWGKVTDMKPRRRNR